MQISIQAKVSRRETFSVRVAPELKQAIHAKAQELNQTASELASQILKQAIDQL